VLFFTARQWPVGKLRSINREILARYRITFDRLRFQWGR